MTVFRAAVLFLSLSCIHAYVWRLNCDQIRQFVDGHNSRRLLLAKGLVQGQPAASRMPAMMWDNELAKTAADWASYLALHDKYEHSSVRTIPSGRFITGENIMAYRSSEANYKLDLDNAMKVWFDEHKDFTYKTLGLEWTEFTSRGPQVGHYTQMAWADTVYVGCGVSQYLEPGRDSTKYLVVCNYGPMGNTIGQIPYKSGNPSNKLICATRDCRRPYGPNC